MDQTKQTSSTPTPSTPPSSGNTASGKKTTTTVVIVLVVVIIAGGVYYGFNRWRQQRLANQFLQQMYGVGVGDVSKLTGGLTGDIAAEIAKEAAEQDAKDKKAAEEEAAKTPEDRFNETKEVSLTGATASIAKDKIEPILTAVFGKVKPVLFSGGYMGQEGSFLASFKVPSVPTSEDFNKLAEEFTSNGYKVVMNSVTADSGNLMLQKDNVTISVSYESPEDQEIGVLYIEEVASEE